MIDYRKTDDSLLLHRGPDYVNGRFFVSPILGCTVRCLFCYIYSHGYSTKPQENRVPIEHIVSQIETHPKYKPGRTGSTISVGAWGDPFPPSRSPDHVLRWLDQLAILGNPIQLVSRFGLAPNIVERIANVVKYPNQLLFSTSISTFSRWNETDTFADPPLKRLETLARFDRLGIPTNVLIKPFIPGITDVDVEIFRREFARLGIKVCVAGIFYWNEQILKILQRRGLVTNELAEIIENHKTQRDLVCSPGSTYQTFDGTFLNAFCDKLRADGLAVFKNLNCVSAWMLGVPHVGELHRQDPHNLCVRCGNCDVNLDSPRYEGHFSLETLEEVF